MRLRKFDYSSGLPLSPTTTERKTKSDLQHQKSYNLPRETTEGYERISHQCILNSINDSTFFKHETPLDFPEAFESNIIECDWWIGGFRFDHTSGKKRRKELGPFAYGPRPACVAGFQPEVHENASGELYMGEVDKEGRRSGRGVAVDADGNLYEGHFEAGRPSGKGRIIYANGKYYDGGWKDGRWHGQGREEQIDGTYFIGSYHEGK